MSTYADPTAAVVWIDGDAFRGPANGADPADPFASPPVTGVTPMLAFGAVKAGFEIDPVQDIKEYDVWNNRSGASFMLVEGNTVTTIKFRASQMSKATMLTQLRGGTVAETSPGSGIFKHTKGASEELSLLLQLRGADGVKKEAHWIPRCKLSKLPTESKGADDLDGFDFEIEALAPAGGGQAVVVFTNSNPLA